MRHPNIIEVYDADVESGTPWIAMELLEGESLGEYLKRGTLSPSETVWLAGEVLAALEVVHQEGIVHRDLKPDNLFLERIRSGGVRLKILDFGIARGSDAQIGRLTRTGGTLGTPWYLSPEQARADKNLDGRSDLYSLGVVLYECLVGRRPFEAEEFGELLHKLFTEEPPKLTALEPAIPKSLESVVDGALQKAVEKRFPNARTMRQAMADAGVEATPVGQATRALSPSNPGGGAAEPALALAVLAPTTAMEDPATRPQQVESEALSPVEPTASTPETEPDAPRTSVAKTSVMTSDPMARTSPLEVEVAGPPRRSAVSIGVAAVVLTSLAGAVFGLSRGGGHEDRASTSRDESARSAPVAGPRPAPTTSSQASSSAATASLAAQSPTAVTTAEETQASTETDGASEGSPPTATIARWVDGRVSFFLHDRDYPRSGQRGTASLTQTATGGRVALYIHRGRTRTRMRIGCSLGFDDDGRPSELRACQIRPNSHPTIHGGTATYRITSGARLTCEPGARGMTCRGNYSEEWRDDSPTRTYVQTIHLTRAWGDGELPDHAAGE